MVTESNCNAIAITDLLQKDHPSIAKQIRETCIETGVQLNILNNASDYWCRDFMPLQVNPGKFVQFHFDPSYYKHRLFNHMKTDVTEINLKMSGELTFSDLVIDGGAFSFWEDVAIVTDRIFKDNPSISKEEVVRETIRLLELRELIVIPALPYDITGHADGMVKFIDRKTLLLNDFRMISGKNYWNRLLKALSDFELVLLPNDLHKNLHTDDATGDYINMCVIRDRLLVPAYNRPTDKLAHTIIRMAFSDFECVPILVNDLASKAGVLHCASWNYLKPEINSRCYPQSN